MNRILAKNKIRKAVISGVLLTSLFCPAWNVEAEETTTVANETQIVADDAKNVEAKEEKKADTSKYAWDIIDKETQKLIMTRKLWTNEAVKKPIEDLLGPYYAGEAVIKHKKDKGPKIKDIPYVIVNVDEAAGINQAQENIAIYQVQRLAFAIKPENMKAVLQTGMTTEMLHESYGADDGEGRQILISSVIDDVVKAYANLYGKKLVKGSGKDLKDEEKSDDYYEFTTKMMWLYHAINATQGDDVAKPWVGYWMTGMTPYEAYNLSIHGVELYGDYVDENEKNDDKKKKKTVKPMFDKEVTLKNTGAVDSSTGKVSVHCKQGISSTKQLAQLVEAVQKAGLDVWVVSSANYETVRATLNYYHVPAPDGMLALRTNVDKSGKYVNQYNAKYHPAPYGKGKIDAVQKEIVGYYKAKHPSMLIKDADDDILSSAYPDSLLIVSFADGEAVSAEKGTAKRK